MPGSGTYEDPYTFAGLVPYNAVARLMPYDSKEHKFFHVRVKKMVRWFVNHAAENKKFQKLLRKKKEEGWINPEVRCIDRAFERVKEIERVMWENPDASIIDKKYAGPYANGNERFWNNAMSLLSFGLDEDSYYLLRFLKFIDALVTDEEFMKLLNMHRKAIYWDTSPNAIANAKRAEAERAILAEIMRRQP